MNIKSSSTSRKDTTYFLQSNLRDVNSSRTHTTKINIKSVKSFEGHTNEKRNHSIYHHKRYALQDDFIEKELMLLSKIAKAKNDNLVNHYFDFLKNFKLTFNKCFTMPQKNIVLEHLDNTIFNSVKNRILFWDNVSVDLFVDFFDIVSEMKLLDGGIYKDIKIKTNNLFVSFRTKLSDLILHQGFNLSHYYKCFNAVDNINLVRDCNKGQDRIILNRLIMGIIDAPFLTSEALCEEYEELKSFAHIIHTVSWKASSKFTEEKNVVDLIANILKKEPYKAKTKLHRSEKKELVKFHMMYLISLANLIKIGMINIETIAKSCHYLIKEMKYYSLNCHESIELVNALTNLIQNDFPLSKDIEFILFNISDLIIKMETEPNENQISYLINSFSCYALLNTFDKTLTKKIYFILEKSLKKFTRMPNLFQSNIFYEQIISGVLNSVKNQNKLSINLKSVIEKITALSLNNCQYLKEKYIIKLLELHFVSFKKKFITKQELVSRVVQINEIFAYKFNNIGYSLRYILGLSSEIKEKQLDENVFLSLLNNLIRDVPKNTDGNTKSIIISIKALAHISNILKVSYEVIISKFNHILRNFNSEAFINLTPEHKISFIASLGSLGEGITDISNLKYFIKIAISEIEKKYFIEKISLADLEKLAFGLMTLHCTLRCSIKNNSSINRYNLRIGILLERIRGIFKENKEHSSALFENITLLLEHWFDKAKIPDTKQIYTYLLASQNIFDEALKKKYENIICEYSHNGLPSVNRAILTDMIVFDLQSQESYIGDSEEKRAGSTLLKAHLYEKNLFDFVEVNVNKININEMEYIDNLLSLNKMSTNPQGSSCKQAPVKKCQVPEPEQERVNLPFHPISDNRIVVDSPVHHSNIESKLVINSFLPELTTTDVLLGLQSEKNNEALFSSVDKNLSFDSNNDLCSSPFVKKRILDYLYSPLTRSSKDNLFSSKFDLDDIALLLDESSPHQTDTLSIAQDTIADLDIDTYWKSDHFSDLNAGEIIAYLSDYSPNALEELQTSSLVFSAPSISSPQELSFENSIDKLNAYQEEQDYSSLGFSASSNNVLQQSESVDDDHMQYDFLDEWLQEEREAKFSVSSDDLALEEHYASSLVFSTSRNALSSEREKTDNPTQRAQKSPNFSSSLHLNLPLASTSNHKDETANYGYSPERPPKTPDYSAMSPNMSPLHYSANEMDTSYFYSDQLLAFPPKTPDIQQDPFWAIDEKMIVDEAHPNSNLSINHGDSLHFISKKSKGMLKKHINILDKAINNKAEYNLNKLKFNIIKMKIEGRPNDEIIKQTQILCKEKYDLKMIVITPKKIDLLIEYYLEEGLKLVRGFPLGGNRRDDAIFSAKKMKLIIKVVQKHPEFGSYRILSTVYQLIGKNNPVDKIKKMFPRNFALEHFIYRCGYKRIEKKWVYNPKLTQSINKKNKKSLYELRKYLAMANIQ